MKLACLNALSKATIAAPISFEFGGVHFKFTASVALITADELKELSTNNDAADVNTVRKLLVGWDDFVDQDKPVPFSADTLNELLAYGGICNRLATECINAQYRVQEKN